MTPDDHKKIHQMIKDALDKREKDNQYGVSPIPNHRHSGTDSSQVSYNDLLNQPTIPSVPVTVPNGGTGATTLTGVLIGNGTSAVSAQAQLALNKGGIGIDASGATDGQLLIGRTSDHTLQLATLTAGSNITITNAGAGITIAAATGAGASSVNIPYTSGTSTITQNVDTTITTTFTATVISLWYRMTAFKSGGSARYTAGQLITNGTTGSFGIYYYHDLTQAAGLTGGDNTQNTLVPSYFNGGTANAGDSGASNCQITLSVNAVTSTTIVVRVAYLAGSGFLGTAACDFGGFAIR